jgi:hypothetical protein
MQLSKAMKRYNRFTQLTCGQAHEAGEQACDPLSKAMKRYNRFTQPTCGQAHEVGEQACDPHTVW